MATANQMELVDNIEASMKALAVQGKGPPSISAVMEDAGYDGGSLFAVVTRLKESGEKELLSRLRSAFEYAKKLPVCLEDVKPSRNGLKIGELPPYSFTDSEAPEADSAFEERDYPGTKARPVKPKAHHTPFVHAATDDEAEALAQILTILRPLKHVGRTRILGASSMFYGVGE